MPAATTGEKRRAGDSQQDQEGAKNGTQDEQDNRPKPRRKSGGVRQSSGALERRADDSQQDQEGAENGTQDEQDNRPPPRLARLLQGMFGLVHGGLESFHLFDDEHSDWLQCFHLFFNRNFRMRVLQNNMGS
jgi:hypothetical protein